MTANTLNNQLILSYDKGNDADTTCLTIWKYTDGTKNLLAAFFGDDAREMYEITTRPPSTPEALAIINRELDYMLAERFKMAASFERKRCAEIVRTSGAYESKETILKKIGAA